MVKHLFLRSWSYVTPIGHWQGKVESGADLAGMSGWQNFAKWKEMYHSGAEEAAIRSTLPFRRIGFADIGKTRVKGKKKPTWKEDYRNHLAQSMESGRCACIIFDPSRVMRVLPQTIRMSKRVGLRSEAAKQRHKWVEFELHTVSSLRSEDCLMKTCWPEKVTEWHYTVRSPAERAQKSAFDHDFGAEKRRNRHDVENRKIISKTGFTHW